MITLALPGGPRVEWKGSCSLYPSKVISYIKAQILIDRGCLSYLAFICVTSANLPSM